MGLQLVFQLLHLAALHSLGLLVGGAMEHAHTAVQHSLTFIYNNKILAPIHHIRKTVCRQVSSVSTTETSLIVFFNGLC